MAFWDEILAQVETFKDQALHPVYDQNGRDIGYFRTDQELAAAHIVVKPGETVPPPEQWRVKSPLGYIVNADVYLINQGLQPSWLAPNGPIMQAIAGDTGGASGSNNGVTFPDLSLPQLPSLGQLGLPRLNTGTWVLIGAFGLLAIVLLRREEA